MWCNVDIKNKRVKGTALLAEKKRKTEREKERKSGSFFLDYFPALFAEEDIGHKKGTSRSGNSCFAIKSDLNFKPFPCDRRTRRYLPCPSPTVSLFLIHSLLFLFVPLSFFLVVIPSPFCDYAQTKRKATRTRIRACDFLPVNKRIAK